MAWGRIRTEHSGAKRGKGYWGRKSAAKQASSRVRRRWGRAVVEEQCSGGVDRSNNGFDTDNSRQSS